MAAQRLSRRRRAASRATCRPSRNTAPITRGARRAARRLARHTFVGGNFFMLRMLNRYRDELERRGAAAGARRPRRTGPSQYLQTQAARVSIERVERRRRPAASRRRRSRISAATSCRPRIPRAAPGCTSTVRDAQRRGRCSNRARSTPTARSRATTTTPTPPKFEPHYAEIRSADQVQIYEIDHRRTRAAR